MRHPNEGNYRELREPFRRRQFVAKCLILSRYGIYKLHLELKHAYSNKGQHSLRDRAMILSGFSAKLGQKCGLAALLSAPWRRGAGCGGKLLPQGTLRAPEAASVMLLPGLR